MKSRIVLLAAVVAGFSSCATYRSGQTPDDVYYSPAREVEAYVETTRDDEGRTSYNNDRLEDDRLRQQIRDQRFRSFDDDFYWNNPRYSSNWGLNSWNNHYGWGSSWNTWGLGWNSWNSWNNPYGWNTWNSPFVCVPGTTIIIPGPGAPKNSQGVRYSPPVQNYNTAVTNRGNGGKFGPSSTGNGGSRYFGGASNNNNRRSSFFNNFFGGSTNSGGGSFNSGNSSNSGGSRVFGGGSSSGSSGGSSSGGGSKPSGGTGGRRN
jgi:hypothetical protein